MHYGAYGFAVDPTVPTIIVPEGVEIGQRLGFSEVTYFSQLDSVNIVVLTFFML